MNDSTNSPTFEELAILLHGNLYDYSEVVYFSSKTRVTIGCDLHGNFERTPTAHLNGFGCPRCSEEIKPLDPVKVVASFNELHGNLYKYPDLTFKQYTDSIRIICPFHGEYKRTVRSHLGGSRCTSCLTLKKVKRVTEVTDRMESELFNQAFSHVVNNQRKTSVIIRTESGEGSNGTPHSLRLSELLFKVFVTRTLLGGEDQQQFYIDQFKKELNAAHRVATKATGSDGAVVNCVVATDSTYRKSFDNVTKLEFHWYLEHTVNGIVKHRNIQFN